MKPRNTRGGHFTQTEGLEGHEVRSYGCHSYPMTISRMDLIQIHNLIQYIGDISIIMSFLLGLMLIFLH